MSCCIQLAEGYRRRIEQLERVLEGPEQEEAREIVRSMIDAVILTPAGRRVGGSTRRWPALAALLALCKEISGDKKPSAARPSAGQLSVLAGARYDFNELLSFTVLGPSHEFPSFKWPSNSFTSHLKPPTFDRGMLPNDSRNRC